MIKVNLRPLADRVIVKPMETEEITKGGIIVPDTAKEKPIEGTIVAVGRYSSINKRYRYFRSVKRK
jgi:chaperonin GroES